ncbi:MAG: transcriptional regulator [Candidatus Altiarchaeales archaeon ex4484_96]|nr:MAG: transcriptional regulator [Candidatus Altiarchaeales archaeon ex4484_96]
MAVKPKVADYMTPEVDYIDSDVRVSDAIETIISSTHENFPVVKDGELIGFLTAKQLLKHYDKQDAKIETILKKKKKLVVARPELDLEDTARVIFRNGYKKLPVVNGNGMLVGIISTLDILRSHIERVTPGKVNMVKNLLESEYGVRVRLGKRLVPVNKLHPTQRKIYADELEGRKYELEKKLAEPIIVVKRKNYFVLVDGHHRAVAALNLGMDELMAHLLEMEPEVELRMEKAAKEKDLITLNDIEVMDYAQHPLMEITTKLVDKDNRNA